MDCINSISCRSCPVREKTVENALKPDDLDKVESFRKMEDWKRGQTIFHEGAPVQNHYSIFEGAVRLVRTFADGRRTVIGFLFPGDLFGLSEGDVYSYSAEAVTPARICRFPRSQMDPLFQEHPGIKQKLIEIIMKKLNIAEKRITDLARKSSEERLATFLISLQNQGSMTDDEGNLKLPMIREDISDFLGLSLETTSRNFTSLVKKGLISIHGKTTIRLLDREKLLELAGME